MRKSVILVSINSSEPKQRYEKLEYRTTKFIISYLSSFRPIPEPIEKNTAMSDEENARSKRNVENRQHSATRMKKSIPPIPPPRKQSAWFAYQYITKFLYRIPERLVENGLMKGCAKVIVKEYRCG